MLLLAGLGNPGPKHAHNRHNVGFMAADEIVRRHNLPAWRARFEGLASEGTIAGTRVVVLKPLTYMNESGRAVGQAMRFFKIEPAGVIVFYDELDLAPGKVRVKVGGGAAGHNGVRSIDRHIGPDFKRVRIGIGHPGDKDRVYGYVLSDFAKTDQDWVGKVVPALADALELLLAGNDNGYMTRVKLLVDPPPPKPPKPAPPGDGADA